MPIHILYHPGTRIFQCVFHTVECALSSNSRPGHCFIRMYLTSFESYRRAPPVSAVSGVTVRQGGWAHAIRRCRVWSKVVRSSLRALQSLAPPAGWPPLSVYGGAAHEGWSSMAFDGAGCAASCCSDWERAAAALLRTRAERSEGGTVLWLSSDRPQAAACCSTGRRASDLRGCFASWLLGHPAHIGWVQATAAAAPAADTGYAAATTRAAAGSASRRLSGTQHHVPWHSTLHRRGHASVHRRTVRQIVQRPLSRPHYRVCHGPADSANGVRLAGAVAR